MIDLCYLTPHIFPQHGDCIVIIHPCSELSYVWVVRSPKAWVDAWRNHMALAERNEVLLGAAHIHTLPWQHSYTLSLYRIVLFCTTCVMQDVQNYTMSKNDTDLAFSVSVVHQVISIILVEMLLRVWYQSVICFLASSDYCLCTIISAENYQNRLIMRWSYGVLHQCYFSRQCSCIVSETGTNLADVVSPGWDWLCVTYVISYYYMYRRKCHNL